MPAAPASPPKSRQPRLGRKRGRYEAARAAAAGIPTMVDPAPYRAHLTTLIGLGLPLHSIARDAGVSDHHLTNIVNGSYQRLRIRHAQAIVAVTHHPNPRQERVLAIGAIRRIQALRALGWRWSNIAAETGLPIGTLSVLASVGRTTIMWSHWEAIRVAYERLSARVGTGRRAHFPTPLDWEYHDIDDPRVTVTAQPWKPKTAAEILAERLDKVAELTAAGLSADQIAEQLGTSQRSVERYRAKISTAA